MKTTIELPEGMLKALQLRADEQGKRVDSIVVELLEHSLKTPSSKLRLPPEPFKLKCGPVSIEDIEEAIQNGRS